jgi:hypothetical protein
VFGPLIGRRAQADTLVAGLIRREAKLVNRVNVVDQLVTPFQERRVVDDPLLHLCQQRSISLCGQPESMGERPVGAVARHEAAPRL